MTLLAPHEGFIKEDKAAMERATWAISMWAYKRFECVDGLPAAQSQTGEPYVEFSQEATSIEGALAEIVSKLTRYAHGKTGKLYWRVRPEMARYGDNVCAYVRLLISDAPVKPNAPSV